MKRLLLQITKNYTQDLLNFVFLPVNYDKLSVILIK